MANLLLVICLINNAYAQRLHDIADVSGNGPEQLFGYGLVVGLNGTGDDTDFNRQSVIASLKKLGLTLPTSIKIKGKGAATVSLSSSLPRFAKIGQTIDVQVAAIGNASSLNGGRLLMSSLKGVDGKVYALAQGQLLSEMSASDPALQDGSKLMSNIPNGGVVQQAPSRNLVHSDTLVFTLKQADYSIASRVVKAINSNFGPDVAVALDAGSIRVRLPRDSSQRVMFISTLENLEIDY